MLTQVIIIALCFSPFYRLKKLKAALIFGKHCSSWPYLQQ